MLQEFEIESEFEISESRCAGLRRSIGIVSRRPLSSIVKCL